MNKQHKITSTDIANAAGVSQSTVSMILRGKNISSFSGDTVRRVLEAADKLGYVRTHSEKNPSADSGARQIMIFCPVLSNPYYTTVVQAIEQVAHEQGYRTVICTTYRSGEIELQHLAAAEADNFAGIIFTSVPVHVKMAEHINKRVPIVVIGDRNDLISVDTVEVNSYRSGIEVAKYLMHLGHRRIAFLSTSLNRRNTIRLKRMEGVRDALEASGHGCRLIIKSRDTTSVEDNLDSDIEYKVGRELAVQCIEKEKVTALVAVNDMVAYGALDALREKGFRIPQDYSVCGFDNIFPSCLNGIRLTSVENFMVQKGRNAMDMLLERIQQNAGQTEKRHDGISRVEYQPRLIIRETTGVHGESGS